MKEKKSRFGLNNNDNSSPKPYEGREFLSSKNIDDDSGPKPEEPEECPDCHRMIDPFDKNTHPACCQGH